MDAWEQHVNTFDLIASRGKPPRLGTKRIDFVAGHLDILDRKFSSLLTFHGLMASVVGLYLNVSLPHPIHHLSSSFRRFWLVWTITTILCLLGVWRAKWGDLGGGPAQDAERKQVLALIESVMNRTALFRLAIILT